MTLRDNKMIILRILGVQVEPISLPQLMTCLGKDFKERSVRRWLKELVHDGSVKQSGQKRGTKYFAAGRSEENSHNHVSSCFSSSSIEAIQAVRKPLFERKPITYSTDWFDSYHPNQTYYLNHHLRQQLHLTGQRAYGHNRAGTYAHQIFNRLMIDLSYNSSRLEGNTYSLLDTERLLLHGDIAEGKLDEEKAMILNHKEAIRYLVDNVTKIEITTNVICTLHYLLSDGLVEPNCSGKVRTDRVRVGGSTYIPFEDPKRIKNQLDNITQKAALILDPYEQSLFLLVHISYLQGFIDVNKRTARLASNIPLIRDNLVPLAFNDVLVDDYISAMIAIYELQDPRPLVDLYVYSYLRTCAAYDVTLKAMGFDEVRIKYRQERRDLIRKVISLRLLGDKLTTFIKEKTNELIPEASQELFIEDLFQDLQQLDETRILGLGVTLEEMNTWKSLYNSSK